VPQTPGKKAQSWPVSPAARLILGYAQERYDDETARWEAAKSVAADTCGVPEGLSVSIVDGKWVERNGDG